MDSPYRLLPKARLFRTWLYRKGLVAVILTALTGLAALWPGLAFLDVRCVAQTFGRKPAYAGPRAVGLVQLSSSGKARLIPIVIMMNGKFYEASSYKATPVPMALDFGVVYEAFKTGVSQGTFTITQPGQLNHSWIAEGTWLPAGVKAASENTRKYAPPVIEDNESKSDRPVLHRRAEGKGDQDDQKPASSSSAPPASAPSSSTSPGSASGGSTASTQGADAKKTGEAKKTEDATQPTTSKADTKSATAAKTSADDEPISDPNRPRLRRGKPDPKAHHELFVDFDALDEAAKKNDVAASGAAGGAATATRPSSDVPPPVLTVAAVSDAGGPDPRPYTYDLKPAEEAIYRKKMLELAAKFVKPAAGSSAAGRSPAGQGSAGGSRDVRLGARQGGIGAGKQVGQTAVRRCESAHLRSLELE